MTREEITIKLAEFERTHPVETYTIYGTHVWPVIRVTIALALSANLLSRLSAYPPDREIAVNTKRKQLKDFIYFNYHYFKYCLLKNLNFSTGFYKRIKSRTPKGEIVIVTNPTRKIELGDIEYHTVVGPLEDILSQKGISTIIWERNSTQFTDFYYPDWQSEINNLAQGFTSLKFAKRLPQFDWFNDLNEWLNNNFKTEMDWNLIEAKIRRVFHFSRIAEKWLKKTGCRIVITDCWYNIYCLAFILAASRLGIKTVDFQHGMQGPGHFSYQAWEKGPSKGYALFPDKFWVWGKNDADILIKNKINNINLNDVIIGGNLWINKWLNDENHIIKKSIEKSLALTEKWEKSILVTLQKGIDLETILFDVIKNSPKNWLWLIRIHRQETDQLANFEKRFWETGHPGINLRDAIEHPLYALFHSVDAHITGFSTCALEALAFDIPTVLIHKSGKYAYQKYIDKGTMYYSIDTDSILKLATNCFDIEDGLCRRVGNDAFAPLDYTEPAINKIISY